MGCALGKEIRTLFLYETLAFAFALSYLRSQFIQFTCILLLEMLWKLKKSKSYNLHPQNWVIDTRWKSSEGWLWHTNLMSIQQYWSPNFFLHSFLFWISIGMGIYLSEYWIEWCYLSLMSSTQRMWQWVQCHIIQWS